MSDDNKTKVTVRKKELASVIDSDLAQKMWARKSGHWVAIIELRHQKHGEDVDNGKDVALVISELEIVDDGILDGRAVDHVRDIMAALHRNRKLDEDGPQLPIGQDGPEPTVEGVLAARDALVEHDDSGPKLWDGQTLPDDEDDEPEEPAPDDAAYEPHTFVDTPDATCGYAGCGQPAGAAIHTGDREPATT